MSRWHGHDLMVENSVKVLGMELFKTARQAKIKLYLGKELTLRDNL
jgi:hypothetical protein